jgi:hypothetical protein
MSDTGYADLPELAGHLRSVVADKAQRRPDKSPFILLYAFQRNRQDTAVDGLQRPWEGAG